MAPLSWRVIEDVTHVPWIGSNLLQRPMTSSSSGSLVRITNMMSSSSWVSTGLAFGSSSTMTTVSLQHILARVGVTID